MNDYIEVNTSVQNPNYPTRVRIVEFDGTLEHAGDYTPPTYTFSVKVEICYNKVVDGKEVNLITCSFWTTEDHSTFSFEEDEDLDEESIDDWFWEGLSDDLSFHDLECLEDLDFYALGVPTCEEDTAGQYIDDIITEAFDKSIQDHYEEFEYKCSKLFEIHEEHSPFKKELVIPNGDCKTVWSIDGFEFERDSEEDVQVSFYVSCCFYIKDELLYCVEFKTEKDYLMTAGPHNLYNQIVKKIEKTDFNELAAAEDVSELCSSFDDFAKLRESYDSFEEAVSDYIDDNYYYDNYEGVEVTLGDLAEEWENRFLNLQ